MSFMLSNNRFCYLMRIISHLAIVADNCLLDISVSQSCSVASTIRSAFLHRRGTTRTPAEEVAHQQHCSFLKHFVPSFFIAYSTEENFEHFPLALANREA